MSPYSAKYVTKDHRIYSCSCYLYFVFAGLKGLRVHVTRSHPEFSNYVSEDGSVNGVQCISFPSNNQTQVCSDNGGLDKCTLIASTPGC